MVIPAFEEFSEQFGVPLPTVAYLVYVKQSERPVAAPDCTSLALYRFCS